MHFEALSERRLSGLGKRELVHAIRLSHVWISPHGTVLDGAWTTGYRRSYERFGA